MESIPFWLPFAFFAIALLYAMVGFGGGSSYLAVLALIGVSHTVIPQVALVCNIIVSGGGVWHFRRTGHLAFGKIAPFIAVSIPMAYLGGRIAVGQDVFIILLAVSLFAAGARTLMPSPDLRGLRHVSTVAAWRIGLPLGAVLGFFAGVVGIGGGIFLSPALILIRWADARGAAAAASVFVLVNSLSGLAGQFTKGIHVDPIAGFRLCGSFRPVRRRVVAEVVHLRIEDAHAVLTRQGQRKGREEYETERESDAPGRDG